MIKRILALVLPLFLSACTRIDLVGFSLGVPLEDDPVWGSFEMVIDTGSEGTLDTSRINDCTVILDDETYKMWYSGSDGANYRIIYAESADGREWTNFQESLSPGNMEPYDTTSLIYPSVMKAGNQYKMWYSAMGDYGKIVIIYCDSWDGLSWSNFQVAVDIGSEGDYDASGAYSPTVLLYGGKYRMWYAGLDAGNTADRIIYCESLDGKTWDNHRVVVDINNLPGHDDLSSNSPIVIIDGGLYKMWYSGQSMAGSDLILSTLYCDSADGITWNNYKTVIQAGGEETYSTTLITGPEVINTRGTGMMWYRGRGEDGTYRIYFCSTGP